MTSDSQRLTARIALQTTLILVGSLFLSVTAADLWLLAGPSLTPPVSIAILTVGLLGSLAVATWLDRPVVLPALGVAILVYAVALLIASHTRDLSADGRLYHFDALYALVHGWNPTRESYADFRPPTSPLLDFIDSYGKSGWIWISLQVLSGLNYETAKDASLVFPMAAFAACFGVALSLRARPLPALALALVAAANPIAIQEAVLRMNDGEMSSLIVIFLSGVALWILRRDRIGLFIALPAMAVAMNLKLSGLPILVILCAALVVADARRNGPRMALTTTGVLLTAGLAGMLVIGFSPYVLNTIHHGFPYYPLSNDSWAAMMEGDWPTGFETMAPLKRLAESFFSASGYNPHLKIPLTLLGRQEFQNAGDVEVMVGGLGPFYSGAVLLALATAAWLAFKDRWSANGAMETHLIIAGGVLASSLPLPQSWYFRYVPHLWLFPVAIAAAAWSSKDVRARWLAAGLAALLLLNSLIVGASLFVQNA